MKKQLYIIRSFSYYFKILFATVLLMAIFDFLTLLSYDSKEMFKVMLGVSLVILFTVICFYTVKMLLNKKPLVIINDKGIVDNSTIFRFGLIPWENIAGIDLDKKNKDFLKIELYNQNEILSRYDGIKRSLLEASILANEPIVVIPKKNLKIENEKEFMEIIATYYQKNTAK